MVLHNPNNWHWVSKDATGWTKQWLEENLVGKYEEDGVDAQFRKVVSMDGDIDVNQRKGKVITIFDFKLVVEYEGHNKDGEEVSGTITVPEVAHDTEENEYVFDIDIYADANSKQPVKDLVRKKMVPSFRQKFQELAPALIKEHGKDIQHTAASNPAIGASTPKVHVPSGPAPTSHTAKTNSSVNTTTVTDTEEFRAPATECYQVFTDPQRIAAFTRAAPKLFEGAKKGGKFELFGGNITGEYLELVEPTKIVQSWRLDQWPKGHFSRLEITFDQNDVDNVTVMRVSWSGVPVGQEEVTKRNWREYYVRSIKQTFG
ncbi:Uncharacterized protein LSUE1_G003155 [Lachnellula suecica]|uniref:Activator of Hsp90 ATPase AHSA1-like N-terminal domain-containing protein n=1 Tax=Lachnellula suecica TaxID=602035 RepID=A0A8T9CBL1_9HELO|nr:Uncharacterized protein LSUE1_G003155 [Lachnellula suecica]